MAGEGATVVEEVASVADEAERKRRKALRKVHNNSITAA
jgi:hypothetical protein